VNDGRFERERRSAYPVRRGDTAGLKVVADDPPPASRDRRGDTPRRGQLRSIASGWVRHYAIVWLTVALFGFLSVHTDGFLTGPNLRNILDQQSTIVIAAAFATLTMIAGGFDISLSAIFVLTPLVALRVENATDSIWLPLIVAAGLGLAIGLVTGAVIAWTKVNSLIATLATSFVLFGIAYDVSDASVLRAENPAFRDLATGELLGIRSSVWIAIGAVAVAWILLARTRFGRAVYAVGGNAEAARLAGIRVGLVRASTFALGGFAAGLAGIITASRTLSAQASDSFGFVFAVITAIVVGGTEISGGQGGVGRSVCGALFIAFMINGFNLNGVDPIYQRVIQGLVMLAAVAVAARARSARA
jgi:ribose transport system permease protein